MLLSSDVDQPEQAEAANEARNVDDGMNPLSGTEEEDENDAFIRDRFTQVRSEVSRIKGLLTRPRSVVENHVSDQLQEASTNPALRGGASGSGAFQTSKMTRATAMQRERQLATALESRDSLAAIEEACNDLLEEKLQSLAEDMRMEINRRDAKHAEEVTHLLEVAEKLKHVYDEVDNELQFRDGIGEDFLQARRSPMLDSMRQFGERLFSDLADCFSDGVGVHGGSMLLSLQEREEALLLQVSDVHDTITSQIDSFLSDVERSVSAAFENRLRESFGPHARGKLGPHPIRDNAEYSRLSEEVRQLHDEHLELQGMATELVRLEERVIESAAKVEHVAAGEGSGFATTPTGPGGSSSADGRYSSSGADVQREETLELIDELREQVTESYEVLFNKLQDVLWHARGRLLHFEKHAGGPAPPVSGSENKRITSAEEFYQQLQGELVQIFHAKDEHLELIKDMKKLVIEKFAERERVPLPSAAAKETLLRHLNRARGRLYGQMDEFQFEYLELQKHIESRYRQRHRDLITHISHLEKKLELLHANRPHKIHFQRCLGENFLRYPFETQATYLALLARVTELEMHLRHIVDKGFPELAEDDRYSEDLLIGTLKKKELVRVLLERVHELEDEVNERRDAMSPLKKKNNNGAAGKMKKVEDGPADDYVDDEDDPLRERRKLEQMRHENFVMDVTEKIEEKIQELRKSNFLRKARTGDATNLHVKNDDDLLDDISVADTEDSLAQMNIIQRKAVRKFADEIAQRKAMDNLGKNSTPDKTSKVGSKRKMKSDAATAAFQKDIEGLPPFSAAWADPHSVLDWKLGGPKAEAEQKKNINMMKAGAIGAASIDDYDENDYNAGPNGPSSSKMLKSRKSATSGRGRKEGLDEFATLGGSSVAALLGLDEEKMGTVLGGDSQATENEMLAFYGGQDLLDEQEDDENALMEQHQIDPPLNMSLSKILLGGGKNGKKKGMMMAAARRSTSGVPSSFDVNLGIDDFPIAGDDELDELRANITSPTRSVARERERTRALAEDVLRDFEDVEDKESLASLDFSSPTSRLRNLAPGATGKDATDFLAALRAAQFGRGSQQTGSPSQQSPEGGRRKSSTKKMKSKKNKEQAASGSPGDRSSTSALGPPGATTGAFAFYPDPPSTVVSARGAEDGVTSASRSDAFADGDFGSSSSFAFNAFNHRKPSILKTSGVDVTLTGGGGPQVPQGNANEAAASAGRTITGTRKLHFYGESDVENGAIKLREAGTLFGDTGILDDDEPERHSAIQRMISSGRKNLKQDKEQKNNNNSTPTSRSSVSTRSAQLIRTVSSQGTTHESRMLDVVQPKLKQAHDILQVICDLAEAADVEALNAGRFSSMDADGTTRTTTPESMSVRIRILCRQLGAILDVFEGGWGGVDRDVSRTYRAVSELYSAYQQKHGVTKQLLRAAVTAIHRRNTVHRYSELMDLVFARWCQRTQRRREAKFLRARSMFLLSRMQKQLSAEVYFSSWRTIGLLCSQTFHRLHRRRERQQREKLADGPRLSSARRRSGASASTTALGGGASPSTRSSNKQKGLLTTAPEGESNYNDYNPVDQGGIIDEYVQRHLHQGKDNKGMQQFSPQTINLNKNIKVDDFFLDEDGNEEEEHAQLAFYFPQISFGVLRCEGLQNYYRSALCFLQWQAMWQQAKFRRGLQDLVDSGRLEAESWRTLCQEVMQDRDTLHQKFAHLQDVVADREQLQSTQLAKMQEKVLELENKNLQEQAVGGGGATTGTSSTGAAGTSTGRKSSSPSSPSTSSKMMLKSPTASRPFAFSPHAREKPHHKASHREQLNDAYAEYIRREQKRERLAVVSGGADGTLDILPDGEGPIETIAEGKALLDLIRNREKRAASLGRGRSPSRRSSASTTRKSSTTQGAPGGGEQDGPSRGSLGTARRSGGPPQNHLPRGEGEATGDSPVILTGGSDQSRSPSPGAASKKRRSSVSPAGTSRSQVSPGGTRRSLSPGGTKRKSSHAQNAKSPLKGRNYSRSRSSSIDERRGRGQSGKKGTSNNYGAAGGGPRRLGSSPSPGHSRSPVSGLRKSGSAPSVAGSKPLKDADLMKLAPEQLANAVSAAIVTENFDDGAALMMREYVFQVSRGALSPQDLPEELRTSLQIKFPSLWKRLQESHGTGLGGGGPEGARKSGKGTSTKGGKSGGSPSTIVRSSGNKHQKNPKSLFSKDQEENDILKNFDDEFVPFDKTSQAGLREQIEFHAGGVRRPIGGEGEAAPDAIPAPPLPVPAPPMAVSQVLSIREAAMDESFVERHSSSHDASSRTRQGTVDRASSRKTGGATPGSATSTSNISKRPVLHHLQAQHDTLAPRISKSITSGPESEVLVLAQRQSGVVLEILRFWRGILLYRELRRIFFNRVTGGADEQFFRNKSRPQIRAGIYGVLEHDLLAEPEPLQESAVGSDRRHHARVELLRGTCIFIDSVSGERGVKVAHLAGGNGELFVPDVRTSVQALREAGFLDVVGKDFYRGGQVDSTGARVTSKGKPRSTSVPERLAYLRKVILDYGYEGYGGCACCLAEKQELSASQEEEARRNKKSRKSSKNALFTEKSDESSGPSDSEALNKAFAPAEAADGRPGESRQQALAKILRKQSEGRRHKMRQITAASDNRLERFLSHGCTELYAAQLSAGTVLTAAAALTAEIGENFQHLQSEWGQKAFPHTATGAAGTKIRHSVATVELGTEDVNTTASVAASSDGKPKTERQLRKLFIEKGLQDGNSSDSEDFLHSIQDLVIVLRSAIYACDVGKPEVFVGNGALHQQLQDAHKQHQSHRKSIQKKIASTSRTSNTSSSKGAVVNLDAKEPGAGDPFPEVFLLSEVLNGMPAHVKHCAVRYIVEQGLIEEYCPTLVKAYGFITHYMRKAVDLETMPLIPAKRSSRGSDAADQNQDVLLSRLGVVSHMLRDVRTYARGSAILQLPDGKFEIALPTTPGAGGGKGAAGKKGASAEGEAAQHDPEKIRHEERRKEKKVMMLSVTATTTPGATAGASGAEASKGEGSGRRSSASGGKAGGGGRASKAGGAAGQAEQAHRLLHTDHRDYESGSATSSSSTTKNMEKIRSSIAAPGGAPARPFSSAAVGARKSKHELPTTGASSPWRKRSKQSQSPQLKARGEGEASPPQAHVVHKKSPPKAHVVHKKSGIKHHHHSAAADHEHHHHHTSAAADHEQARRGSSQHEKMDLSPKDDGGMTAESRRLIAQMQINMKKRLSQPGVGNDSFAFPPG
ncbi:unnamed protein product [Amoebophrya sp. A25]|nr:unnamed protein product [Amoebophrya sp. A25]|eukprot:GSA25T00009590001.1